MDLQAKDVSFIHAQDFTLRHVSSQQLLEAHKGEVFGDMYSLSNYGFLIAKPGESGHVLPQTHDKVDAILKDDPGVLAQPLREKIRRTIHLSLSPNYIGDHPDTFRHASFILMRHPGSHQSSYTSGGAYDDTLGKHGSGNLNPGQIESVLRFDERDIGRIAATPLFERFNAAADIMTDKVVERLRDLADGRVPAQEKGAAAIYKAISATADSVGAAEVEKLTGLQVDTDVPGVKGICCFDRKAFDFYQRAERTPEIERLLELRKNGVLEWNFFTAPDGRKGILIEMKNSGGGTAAPAVPAPGASAASSRYVAAAAGTKAEEAARPRAGSAQRPRL